MTNYLPVPPPGCRRKALAQYPFGARLNSLRIESSPSAMTTSIIAADPKQRRNVLTGTLVGTTIEFYDFLIYAQAAAIVLGPLFIEPATQSNPQLAQVLS